MAVALCTFTTGSSVFNLGTEDCFVTIRKEVGRTIYTVTAHYVDREGNRFYVDGETRGRAEVYVKELAENLAVRPLVEIDGPDGPLFVPDSVAEGGTLANPYTELSEDNCYCTNIEHEDDGGRLYGIVFTFEQPDIDPSAVPSDSIVKYKGIELGNLPGFVVENPESNFIRYEVTTSYRGDDEAQYPNSLAVAIGMLPFVEQEIVRATFGSLGEIKSWNAAAGTLEWPVRSLTVEDLYVRSIAVNRQAPGLLSLNLTFLKGR